MKDYLKHTSKPMMHEVELLKIGTHFRFKEIKIIHSESDSFKSTIECAKQHGVLLSSHQNRKKIVRYVYIEPTDDPEINEFAEQLCAFYPKAYSKEAEIQRIDLSSKEASKQKKVNYKKIPFKKYKI
jgi:hypothetical protein